MVELTLYQKHRIIESRILFEMKIHKNKYYRFGRIKEWVDGRVSKQELILGLIRLEQDEKIETMTRSNRKYYKVNKLYTV